MITGFERAGRQWYEDLVALAEIAHVGASGLHNRGAGRTGFDHRQRFLAHLVDEGIDCGQVEIRQPHRATAHQLIGDRCAQETDGGSDPGIRRHDHPDDAELLGQSPHVQGGPRHRKQ